MSITTSAIVASATNALAPRRPSRVDPTQWVHSRMNVRNVAPAAVEPPLVRIQLVNATRSLNISAGVWKPSVLRGLWFNCLAIALS